jgi:hypothetical protein
LAKEKTSVEVEKENVPRENLLTPEMAKSGRQEESMSGAETSKNPKSELKKKHFLYDHLLFKRKREIFSH